LNASQRSSANVKTPEAAEGVRLVCCGGYLTLTSDENQTAVFVFDVGEGEKQASEWQADEH
jgi:hypothetical protein